MINLWQDISHSTRLLARSPIFSIVAIVTLAIALGANTAVFSITNGVLLRSLPYPDADRIVAISIDVPPREGTQSRSSFLDSVRLANWPERTATIEQLAAYRTHALTLSGVGPPERLIGASVGTNLFKLLGVTPVLGRTFSPGEELPGTGKVVVLSHGFWRRRFAGSPAILGRSLVLAGVPCTVIGVMPDAFAFPQREVELWTPLNIPTQVNRGADTVSVESFPVIARLRRGVSTRKAQIEAQEIFRRLTRSVVESDDELRQGRVRLVPLRDEIVGAARPALMEISTAVGLVLAIACINLANLLLARNGARQRELSIRSAVGANRTRLVRQMLTESIVLSLIGGVAGMVLASWIHRLLPRFIPHKIPRIEEIQLDARVFLFALGLAIATGVFFGILPALRSTGRHLALSTLTGAGESAGRSRSASVLVVVEIALAFVLLVSGGLLIRSYLSRVGVQLGYEPHRVLAATLELDPAKYSYPARAVALLDELLHRLSDHQGVEAVGVISFPPLAPTFSLTSVRVPGTSHARTLAVPQMTSPGYCQAMALHMAFGRWFTAQDVASGARVAVVSETFARRYLPGRDPIGLRIEAGRLSLGIIGVLRDVRTLGVDTPAKPEIFTSYHQQPGISGSGPDRMTLAIRTVSEPLAVVPFLRTVLFQLDPGIALEDVNTMSAKLAASEAEARFYALLLGAFAAVALVLAAAGVYGLLAYSVSRQTRAIGVRRALGARSGDILAVIMGRGLILIGMGIAIGLVVSSTATRVLSHLLFGITALDPLSYCVAALALLIVGVFACYLPARKAATVDPIQALRFDG